MLRLPPISLHFFTEHILLAVSESLKRRFLPLLSVFCVEHMKRPAGGAGAQEAAKDAHLKSGKLSNEVLSLEQAAVCTFVEGSVGSAIITARAGSGKTRILIEALKRIREDKKVRGGLPCGLLICIIC